VSNHIGNANKMVRDTPRMDSVAGHARGIVDAAILAEGMKLERELNAANDRIKRLEAVVNDPHALWTNWLRGDVKLPAGIGDVRQYQDHIKRLEDAGDELGYRLRLRDEADSDAYLKWLKAKEAKP